MVSAGPFKAATILSITCVLREAPALLTNHIEIPVRTPCLVERSRDISRTPQAQADISRPRAKGQIALPATLLYVIHVYDAAAVLGSISVARVGQDPAELALISPCVPLQLFQHPYSPAFAFQVQLIGFFCEL